MYRILGESLNYLLTVRNGKSFNSNDRFVAQIGTFLFSELISVYLTVIVYFRCSKAFEHPSGCVQSSMNKRSCFMRVLASKGF